MRPTRPVAFVLIALLTTFVAVGCGGDGGSNGGGRTGGGGEPARFDASRIAHGAPGVVVRLDDARLDASFDVLRRVSGVRAVEEDLPSRDQALRTALELIGIDIPAGARLSGWIGDEAGATQTPEGWVAWARIRDGRTKEAERFVARADDVAARVEGDELVVAANERALRAAAQVEDPIEDDRRWKELEDARSADGALVAASDGGQVAVAGTDDDGVWVTGRGRAAGSCKSRQDDALDAVGGLSVGTTVGIARDGGVTAERTRAWLRAGLDVFQPIRASVPETGLVTRVVGALDRAVASTLQALGDETAAHGGALGMQDVGTANPALSSTDDEASGTLAADSGFAATRALIDVDERTDVALWLDPVRVIRAVGESQLDGIEGGVVGALGDGVDGVLAWRTCAGELGARVAISD